MADGFFERLRRAGAFGADPAGAFRQEQIQRQAQTEMRVAAAQAALQSGQLQPGTPAFQSAQNILSQAGIPPELVVPGVRPQGQVFLPGEEFEPGRQVPEGTIITRQPTGTVGISRAQKPVTVQVGGDDGIKFQSALAKETHDLEKARRGLGSDAELTRRLEASLDKKAARSPEQAGKIAQARQALEVIPQVREAIFDDEGNVRRAVIAQMNIPIVGGQVPGTRGALARNRLADAIEARLRLETGAAATQSEIDRLLQRFLPKVTDTSEIVNDRLDRLTSFFEQSLEKSDPDLNTALRRRAEGQTFNHPVLGDITMDDIESTAKARGLSTQEVMQRLGL